MQGGMGKSHKVAGKFLIVGLVLVEMLAMAGCGGSSSSTSGTQTATPAFSPGGGTYTASTPVTLSDATQGAVLYCTTDGTTPTASSPQCSQPTTVFKSEFLQAIAVAPGMSPSAVASAGYTINLNTAPTPSISPAGGTYTGPQQIKINDSLSGANIYYTLDGSTPTASSKLYTGPLTISQNTTLSAVAIAAGYTASAINSATYTIQAQLPTPVISSISPTFASAGGAAFTLTVNGTNFVSGSTVQWSGTALATTYGSATQLTAAVPASLIASAGTANVTVAQASGVSAATTFTINNVGPTITALNPSSGAAGTSVTITGTNFTGATAVNFGATPATSFNVNSATSITAVAPAGSGTVDVKVVAPNGTSATAAADQFTYSANAPTVTGISPASGPSAGGTSVTITGTNFTGATAVNFGATPATSLTVNSATSITAVSPAGSGTVDITVVTPGGTSVTSTVDQFIFGAITLNGTVVSGTSPITGATVQLYAAGTTGYGKGSSALATIPATILTDSKGTFTLQYACPAGGAPGDQMYLVATGGDSGSGANSSLALMAGLGTCGTLPSSVTLNEVTTIASAYALSAFATVNTSGGITVGAPALATTDLSCNAASGWLSTGIETCNYTGLSSAFKAVSNLVDLGTGTALTNTPAYKVDLAGDPNILNNSTVPTTRINALADMLASCVESSGSSCGSGLFASAKPSGGTQPGDTLQAALDIAQNPGNNVATLLGLVASMTTQPYSLTSPDPGSSPLAVTGPDVPTDLTLALTFTGAGLGVGPGVTFADGSNGGSLNGAMGVDAAGNIWVGAGIFSTNTYQTSALMIAGFNALGAPLSQTPATTLSSGTPTYGGYNPEPNLNLIPDITSLAIDQSGNLWVNDGTGNVVEINTSPSLSAQKPVSVGVTQGMAIDGSGNAWFIVSGTNVGDIQANGTIGITGTTLSSYNLSYLAFDVGGGLWAAGKNPAFGGDVLQVSTLDGSISYDAFPSSSSPASYSTTLAADGGGHIYGCDGTGTKLNEIQSGSVLNTYPIATQRACGTQLVLDGQGHLFSVLNNPSTSSGVGNFNTNIDEFTTGGKLISPLANGYTGTSSTETPTLITDTNVLGNPVPGISAAIDSSGDLWVLNADSFGSNVRGNALVEYIGIGAPVITPASTALANGLLGVRP
ncbi:chitobiase/beta-hexosaminidase C-terminal domain-containing protein [Granulicella mallensis]|uniref:IPT/TIG domain-containing protein n=1 Tax=Granulicella mallensis TaxID=940614 RepID=A0A7W8EAX5_9BACT|nr:chitobiase/beta-hexosaminidase C-terminal domain-containing protein [Granulicella mallensis]MBB5066078.1 hypothetical protein [Granulicella mallensis]